MANNRNLTQEPQKGKPVKLVKIMRERKKSDFSKKCWISPRQQMKNTRNLFCTFTMIP